MDSTLPKATLPASCLRAEAVRILRQLARSPSFAYITILLLQIKVIWGMWSLRDLTSGDTSAYFVNAYRWFQTGLTPICWSPLYIWFYGSLLHLSSDVFVITTMHRLFTVLILAMLVLALMRQLLPPEIAWLMAAWWVILPIGFDALYEVHLFAVIPIATAAVFILRTSSWWRGSALALMVAASFLMRNELFLASGLLAGTLAGALLWKAIRDPKARGFNLAPAVAYVVPLIGACLLVAYSYRHASDAGRISETLKRKHTLNICQTYAFGYQQRHADFTKSPWVDCQELMLRTYGEPEPTLTEAIRRNPAAMMEHFLWNVRLLPDGLEVLLLNRCFGTVTPDYAPIIQSWIALPLTFVILGIGFVGGARLWRDRRDWWDTWLKSRAWGWLLLMAVGCVTVGVMISQRPRPSYMFALGILLRAATGMCIFGLVRRSVNPRWLSLAFPVTTIAAVVLVPSFYIRNSTGRPRPLFTGYERIAEYEPLLRAPRATLVSPGYGGELCNYAGRGECRPLDYYELRTHISPVMPWPKMLEMSGATVFYADEVVLADPVCRDFVSNAKTFGWETVAYQNAPHQYWRLLHKISPERPGTKETEDITLGNERLILESGWYDLEVSQGVRFRWSNGDAKILLNAGSPSTSTVSVDIEPGPSVRHIPLIVQVRDGAGKVIQTVELPGRRTITIRLPPESARTVSLVLHAADGDGKPVPHDPRILKFRVFQVLLNG